MVAQRAMHFILDTRLRWGDATEIRVRQGYRTVGDARQKSISDLKTNYHYWLP